MTNPVSGRGPARGRRERKKRRTRREIFDAAMALFAERGFDAATLDEICAAADVARGTFFLHFPSKAALLLDLNRQLAEELAESLAEPRGSAVSEVRAMVDLFGERWPRHAGVMGAMLRELLALPGAEAPGRELRDLVEDVVRRGQERGEFRRNVSPRLAATLFLTTTAALLSGNVYAEGEATPEQIRNELLHALFHGLLEPKTRLKWSPTGTEVSS